MARVLLPPAAVRILVVDDEPTQLETICRGLFVCGHDPCPARSVAEARLLLSACGTPAFDLLLTDISAPDAPGAALVGIARAIAPALPMLVVTGLTHGPGLAAVHALGAPVLAKPFTPAELDAAVRAAGEGGGGLHSPGSRLTGQ